MIIGGIFATKISEVHRDRSRKPNTTTTQQASAGGTVTAFPKFGLARYVSLPPSSVARAVGARCLRRVHMFVVNRINVAKLVEPTVEMTRHEGPGSAPGSCRCSSRVDVEQNNSGEHSGFGARQAPHLNISVELLLASRYGPTKAL